MTRQNHVEEDSNNLDVTGVYAYADSSYERDRELWRGFLSCVLPIILPHSSDTIDQIIIESLAESVEDLSSRGLTAGTTGTKKLDPVVKPRDDTGQGHAIRGISVHIAKAIGVPPEFALASFYNSEYSGEMSTKLHKIHHKSFKKQILILKEENMINDWLANFDKIRTDKQFLDIVEAWKGRLD